MENLSENYAITMKENVVSRPDKSTLAKARDSWLKSAEGKKACAGIANGQYLRNRLELAFLAGAKTLDKKAKTAINICDKIVSQVNMGKHLLVSEEILVDHANEWKQINKD